MLRALFPLTVKVIIVTRSPGCGNGDNTACQHQEETSTFSRELDENIR